jgi:Uma2 family endonuclease
MYTRYNVDENKFEQVSEPDPSYIYTYADYLKWDFEERLELFRGKIFPLSAPNTKHQEASRNILLIIGNFLQHHKCKIFSAPFDVRLPAKNKKKDTEITTVVQPDLCVICDDSKLDERGCCGAPDLVIEILSPGNTRKEVKIKHEIYEEAGVKEYWLAYPAEENIAVFILNDNGKFGGATIYAYGDKIESEAVEGLTVNVKDVFIK